MRLCYTYVVVPGLTLRTKTSTSTGKTGLSPGAAAGIGVGVTLAVVALLAAGGWLFWRRRRVAGSPARTGLSKSAASPEAPYSSPVQGTQHYTSPHELATREQPGELGARPKSMAPGELE